MAVGSGINLKQSDPADIPTPDTGKVTIFIDQTNSDEPSYKDDAGVTHTLVGAAGPSGPAGGLGPPGIEADEGSEGMPIPGQPGVQGVQGIQGPAGPTTLGPMGLDIHGGDDPTIIMLQGSGGDGGGGTVWELIENRTLTGQPQEDFINLSAYSEIHVWCVNVVKSVSGTLNLRASIDNGSTFLTASGDYQTISGLGVPSNINTFPLHSTNATAARTCRGVIYGFNGSSVPKWGFTSNSNTEVFFPGTTALNAIRIFNPAGGNLNTGNIYVFGRK